MIRFSLFTFGTSRQGAQLGQGTYFFLEKKTKQNFNIY